MLEYVQVNKNQENSPSNLGGYLLQMLNNSLIERKLSQNSKLNKILLNCKGNETKVADLDPDVKSKLQQYF